ncbi:MAG: hypothetical protein ACI4DN_09830 [Lachnospiraceae bacterium]
MDIVILRLKYPNDPTGNLAAHQHFVAELSHEGMNIYSVSSIFGKEDRVFGSEKANYELITGSDARDNGFRVPSFIDCTKMYHISLDDTVDVIRLSNRIISRELAERIRERIAKNRAEGNHKVYDISIADLKTWNRRIIK